MVANNKIEIIRYIKNTDIFSCLKNTAHFNMFVNFGLIKITKIINIIWHINIFRNMGNISCLIYSHENNSLLNKMIRRKNATCDEYRVW